MASLTKHESTETLRPPKPEPIAFKRTSHGEARIDEYQWMEDPGSPKVLKHLEEENEYTDRNMEHTQALQETLFKEIKGYIKEPDTSVPVRVDNYVYYERIEKNGQYSIDCRRKILADGMSLGEEEVLLDSNELARGHEEYSIGAAKVSPNHEMLAYSDDTTGSEVNTLHIKDLKTGLLLPDTIHNTGGSIAWSKDSKYIFYTVLNEKHRAHKVLRHTVGTSSEEDVPMFEEEDPRFSVGVYSSKSKEYIFMVSSGFQSNEIHYMRSDDPTDTPHLVAKRENEHEYSVEHQGDSFIIATNRKAKDFRVVKAKIGATSPRKWKDIIPQKENETIEDVQVFKNFIAFTRRVNGVPAIFIYHPDTGAINEIGCPEADRDVGLGGNPMYDATTIRFAYSSMNTPAQVKEYDLKSQQQTTLKTQEIPSGYEKADFITERIEATAADGTKIPISLVYMRGVRTASAPLVLEAYGSYGISSEADFSASLLSLLRRGVIYAIAHVRGGGEMGQKAWRDQGKFLKKKNTFTDYIACAEELIKRGYTSPKQMVGIGGSAGGMLMGAVANMRPELFKALVARVPAVDILNALENKALPGSEAHYEELGDPSKKKFFKYIKGYSPYENVTEQKYPSMLVTAGLNDPRVMFWEPAKWVARLREKKTDNNKILLRTYMGKGHHGHTAKDDAIREQAFTFAYILDQFGITA